ncbi:hypothetical protein ACKVMT_10015 [Halobacteriales archaeon Cl-PHB]
MTDLNAVKGNSTDEVITYQNAPAVARPTPIIELDAESGTLLRLSNIGGEGAPGLPVFMKLRDSNGDHIPVNSSLFFEVERAGQDSAIKHSVQVENLSFYQSNSISEQRDADKIRHAKLMLTPPENAPATGPVGSIDIRDVDAGYFTLDSAVQVDWSNSEFFIASEAAETLPKE